MPRILIIDDEPTYHKMVGHALQSFSKDYEIHTAPNGTEGLQSARQLHPDLIITDVNMPDMTGYDVTRTLRRDSSFAHVPIVVLTTQAGIPDKLQSFEAGADDHVTKPFEPAELVARVGVLLRRAEAAQQAASAAASTETARLIAVHSLRGGIGCTSLAANLAIGLTGLWDKPALLMDLALMTGQVALMLNAPLKRTWADIAQIPADELDMSVIRSLINAHESRLEFIAAPTFPSQAETLSGDLLHSALEVARGYYDYIVADLPHDFSDVTLQALDTADVILLVLAPDMASIRAGVAALDTYRKLGYPNEKIKIILNWTFPKHGIPKEKIEGALGMPINLVIPFVPDKLVEAINLGQPILHCQPNEPVSALLEDFAFLLSKDSQRKSKPVNPTLGWKRVYKRYMERKKQ